MPANLIDYTNLGVGIFAIAALVYVIREFLIVIKNHLRHSTEILSKVSEKTDQDIIATKDNTRVLGELKDLLIRLNHRKLDK